MVMETPTPQIVGREFVRQYYTMLHEAPMHLHRFYSHNSSFVHGGVDKPGNEPSLVTGQADIHKKIVSLNFRDCRAKICQVDSQSTVSNAVVVQVTGELSNDGEPMRRFMQTFVLVPQSPKKYYVHNDIFRYQDEVFADQEEEETVIEKEVPEVPEVEAPPEPVLEPSPFKPIETVAPAPLSNGNANHDEEPAPAEPQPEPEEEQPVVYMKDSTDPAPDPPATRSWASMASKNTPSPANQPLGAKQPQPQRSGPAKQEPKPEKRVEEPQQQRPPRNNRDRQSRDRDGSRPGPDGDDRMRSRYPDNQQIFVGNLPQDMSEDALKNFFSEYGNVIELRINKKNGTATIPNYGFVVFDDEKTVQTVLSQKSFHLNGGHRLNVEEKKQRDQLSNRGGGSGQGSNMGDRRTSRGGGGPRGSMAGRGRGNAMGGARGGRGGFGGRGGGSSR